MTIKRLSVQLANQIAAGEVVERQASVVKELLENAVDAGGKHIVLELKSAGRQMIRVRDDGAGIPRDELPLALAPHATSKISSLEDLSSVMTLGFRGEALASIASVSKLTLTSKIKEADKAYSVAVEGPEQSPNIYPAAHPDGTTVEVCELFFNTPARRRFLKSDRTEMLRIRDVFTRCALANPALAFELISDGKSLLKVTGAPDPEHELKRTARLLGAEYERGGLKVSLEDPALTVTGMILPPPELDGGTSEQIYLFLNGRPVADRMLTHALREGCSEALARQSVLRAVIYLKCDPHEVDVNVHPRKDEVRFHNPVLIHDLLVDAVIKSLASSGDLLADNDLADFPLDNEKEAETPPAFPQGVSAAAADALSQSAEPAFPQGVSARAETTGNAGSPESTAAPVSASQDLPASTREAGFVPESGADYSDPPAVTSSPAPSVRNDALKRQAEARFRDRVAIGNRTLKSTVETLSDIKIDDVQPSGIEILSEPVPGVFFVRYGERFALVSAQALVKLSTVQSFKDGVQTGTVESAPMLMPFAVKLGSVELKALKNAGEAAERCGFSIELKRNAVEITAIPAVIRGCDLAETAPRALAMIADAFERIMSGECPDNLSSLIAAVSSPKILSRDGAQLMLGQLTFEDLLSLEGVSELDLKTFCLKLTGKV